jgi:hypothetical protein
VSADDLLIALHGTRVAWIPCPNGRSATLFLTPKWQR